MKKYIFLGLTLIVGLIIANQAAAIGQITEPINIRSAMRGQEIVSKLTVLNSENKQNVIVLSAEGQIADWTTFYAKSDTDYQTPITEVTIAAGVYQDVGVMFRVPADAANGDYTGELAVMYNPIQESSTDETSSVVSQKISRSVKITVSDEEMISLEASVIPEKFDFAADEPIKVRIIYDNRSNISLTPSVQVKFKQDEQTKYNVIYPYPDGEPAVRSMSIYEIPALTIPTAGLAQGEYLAELAFTRGDTQLLTKYFSFTLGAGAVNGVADINLGGNTVKILLAVIAVLAVAVVVGGVLKKRQAN